jgi:CheY-like chemotaxis protein
VYGVRNSQEPQPDPIYGSAMVQWATDSQFRCINSPEFLLVVNRSAPHMPVSSRMYSEHYLWSGNSARQPRAGIIVLTEKHRKREGLEGLQVGADDCLMKPVAFGELFIRINAVLRRVRRETQELLVGSLHVDFTRYAARRGEQHVAMSTHEIDVLRYMNARAGKIVTRNDLLRNCLGIRRSSADALCGPPYLSPPAQGRTESRKSSVHPSRIYRRLSPDS